ncbi:MAG: endonuclease/exonuclease/phosphatase family protein [Rudaea sp.]
MRVIVATYNTHGGVGLDRRFAPQRIARVIRELDADIVALQELDFRTGADMLDILREKTGMHAVAAHTFRRRDGAFGNGLLSRFPILETETIDLSVDGREPRNAIHARIDCEGIALRIFATHFGLRAIERTEQAARLLTALARHRRDAQVLAGDINEWSVPQRALRILHAHFGESPARRTYPTVLPAFALDRIWASPASALVRVHVHKSPLARLASDHLPLLAELRLEAG